MKNLVIGLMIGLMCLAGCVAKEDRTELDAINSMLFDYSAQIKQLQDGLQEAIAENVDLLKVLSDIAEQDSQLNTKLAELIKSDYSNILNRMSVIEKEQGWMNRYKRDINARLDNMEIVYDPNAPEFKYLADLTDPNWIKENGISKESREFYNISVNRGMALKNQTILAEVAKRLIALEQAHIDPNESVVDPNEVKE